MTTTASCFWRERTWQEIILASGAKKKKNIGGLNFKD